MERRDEQNTAAVHVVVVVVRSGGLAGLKRQWRVEPSPDEAPDWVALLDDCPWDDPPVSGASGGADRYVWRITATTDGAAPEREARVPDSRLDGPWRVLVDRVRHSGGATPAR